MTTVQRSTIFTAGFGAPGWTPAGLQAEVERLGALVVDVRLFPDSRLREWTGVALRRVLGDAYIHVPELGNRNFTRGGPLQLEDPECGIAIVAGLLVKGSVLLLCECPKIERCHRRIVASLLHTATDAPLVHLDPPAPTVGPGELLMLTVKPGWAWALLCAGREVENRNWRAGLAPGTLLGIHAASSASQVEHAAITATIQRLSGQQVPTLDELRAAGQRGALLGVVTVEGWVEESASPWFVGPHGLVVREPRVLARPWRVRPAEVLQAASAS